ncbi:MAG: tetratricopeptide repeat protein [Rhodothermaceae bacterium]|nr:tetratricopeptide repeat protein [Rhodothermaceae bacterium]
MNADLEKNWALLEKEYSDPIKLINRQVTYLQSVMNFAPAFVLEKSKGLIKEAEKTKDNQALARSKGVRGYAYYVVSSYDKALPLLHQALALIEHEDHTFLEHELHGVIALIHISLGNFQIAIEHGIRTRQLIQKLGDRVQEAWTLHGFGLCYQEMGLEEEALANYKESLQIFEEEQELNGIARALTNIGCIYSKQNKYEEALAIHEKCLSIFRECDNKSGEARALNDLGSVHLHLGEYEQSSVYLNESLEIRTAMGFKQAKSSTLISLGSLALAQNDSDKAIAYYDEALLIAQEVKAKKRIFEVHKLLADVYQGLEAHKEANFHLKAFYEHRHAIYNEQISTRINSLKTAFKLEQAQKDAKFAQQINQELRGKNQELKGLLDELKSTQSKLLHAEKLASLGELTAGIAHEIKNPLNFVNNFAALSTEILDELKHTFNDRGEERLADVLSDVDDLLEDLYFNATKINEHGKRADQIIQSMLEHARGKKDHQQATDVNRILMEYVKLAYHGMRASNNGFYVEIKEMYADNLPLIIATPHDLGRVFLNIMNNAFYAMKEKTEMIKTTYTPLLKIETNLNDGFIEVAIMDNGPGIPDKIRKDIFNPFFTTKPSGLGTGLGLSLSYEIVHNEHGGDLFLAQSTPNGSAFVVKLPVSTP